MSGLPGDWSLIDEESYCDIEPEPKLKLSMENWSELPPVPILSTRLLILLRFPHILLLVIVLCVPFWSTPLLEGRLWGLLLWDVGNKKVESAEAEIYYYEEVRRVSLSILVFGPNILKTLSVLDGLINCYDIWEKTTQVAMNHLSSSHFASYAYTPDPSQTEFSQFANTTDIGFISELLAKTLRITGSHTSTIRSLLSALARSQEMRMLLERMYAPASPIILPSTSSGWRSFTATGLRRMGSAISVSTLEEEMCTVDEDDMKARLTPSPRSKGKRPLSLAPSAFASRSPTILSTPSPSSSNRSPIRFSPSLPSRVLSPPPPYFNAHSQTHFPSPIETTTGLPQLPYSTSSSMLDIRSHARMQSLAPTANSYPLPL